jgi:hypothetical protein
VLRTDASDYAAGAVLMQEHLGQLHPVAYFSRKFKPAECKYGAYGRELLAVLFAVRHFEHYLDGQHVTVESDQQALSWFWQQRHLDKQQARWMAAMQAYDLQLRYVQGKCNLVADALSRRPDHREAQCTVVQVASTSLLQQVIKAGKKDKEYRQRLAQAKRGDLPGYEAVQGVLYQHSARPKRIRIVVPDSAFELKRLVLAEMHAAHTAGHMGFYKTLRRVCDSFTWRKVAADVKHYIACCNVCLCSKASTQKPVGLLLSLPVPEQKWEQVSMDFVVWSAQDQSRP